MKRVLFFIFFLNIIYLGYSQPASTKGTEFWLTFTQNYNTNPKLTVYFSGNKNAVITITNPNTTYTKTLNLTANTVVSDTVSLPQCYSTGSGNIANKGLRITSTSEVTMYALNYLSATADATVILPTPALGLNYRVLTYKGLSSTFSSEFCVLATQDSTLVKITPSVTTADNKPKNVPYTVVLNKGQTYNVQSKNDTDITGSLVEVQNCKPVAVWGGTTCSNVPTGCAACDHLWEQLFPLNNWGKEFIVIPTASRSKDRIVVLSDKPGTVININGTPTTLAAAGDRYEADVSTATYITSNKPVCVFIYAVGQTCGGGNGDPMMMWVTPVEQKLNNIIFVSLASSVITGHYVNVVAPTTSINTIKIDGTSVSGTTSVVPSNTAYSYVRKSLSAGSHSITSDSGFTAYAYGYGSAESYGYNVGSSIIDLNRYFTINGVINDNHSTAANSLTVCKNSQITFNGYSGSYTPFYWKWKFNDSLAGTQQSFTCTFPDTGIVKVSMITSWISNNLCSNADTTLDTAFQYVHVIEPVVNILNADTTVCRGVSFNTRVSFSGYPVIGWITGTADLSCISCAEPVITPSATQWYKVRVGGNIGCIVTDSFKVHVIDSVRINVSPDTMICVGAKANIKATITNKDSTISYAYSLFMGNTQLKQDTVPVFEVQPDTATTYNIHINNTCYTATSSFSRVKIRSPLLAQFNDSQLVCADVPGNFRFKAFGGDSSYTAYLYENNQLVDSVKNISVATNYSFVRTFGPAKTYKLILKDDCTSKPDTQNIHFKYRPLPGFTHTPDTLVCLGQAFRLWCKPFGGDSTYTIQLLRNGVAIDSVTGATVGNMYFLSASQLINTTYKIVLRDDCSRQNDTQSVLVRVRTPLSSQVQYTPFICEGSLTNIFVSGNGGDSTYTYYLYDYTTIVDSVANAVNNQSYQLAAHPTTTTDYRVVMTDACTLKPDTHALTYYFRPPIGFTHSPDTIICKGQSTKLRMLPYGGDSTYKVWLLKDNLLVDSILNLSLGDDGSFTVAPDVTTVYKIVLLDECTFRNDTQAIQVRVRNPLSTNIVNAPIICRGQNLPMTVTPNGGDSTYNLYLLRNLVPIDSAVNTIANAAYGFNTVPLLNATYKYVLKDGCTTQNDTHAVVFAFRDSLALTRPPGNTICIGQSHTIQFSPSGGDSSYTAMLLEGMVLKDSIANCSVGNSYSFTVSPGVSTTYRLVLRDNCTVKNDTQVVQVNVRNPVGNLVQHPIQVCEGALTNISVKGLGGDSSYTFYLFENGILKDSITGATATQSYQFGAYPSSSVTYKVVTTDGCTFKSDTQSMVYTFRSPIGFTHSPDTLICRGQSTRLRIKPFGGDSTYKAWLLLNNTPVDSLSSIILGNTAWFTVTPAAPTTYKIVLSDGCTYRMDTQTVSINLRNPLSMNIINTPMICRGQFLPMSVIPNGGDSSYNLYLLRNNIAIDSVKNAITNGTYNFSKIPDAATAYSYVLKDGCTVKHDTETVIFTFRDTLALSHSPGTTLCIGQTYPIQFSAAGGDSSYSIFLLNSVALIDSVGNATIGNTFTRTVGPVVSTTYRMVLRDYCTAKNDTQYVPVQVRNKLSMAVSPDTLICKGQTIPIRVTPFGGDSSYSIYLFRGNVPVDSFTNVGYGSTYNFMVNPVVKTNYLVLLTDGCTQKNDSIPVTVDVYPPLQVKASISANRICAGQLVTLTASASGGAVNSTFTYTWNNGGGVGQVRNVIPADSTMYTVRADDGCSSPAFDSVYVALEPVPVASFKTTDTSGCEPYVVSFINNSSSANHVRYLWYFGDNSTDTLQQPSPHTYVYAGSYPVILRLRSDFGCTDSMIRLNYIRVFDVPRVRLKIDPRQTKVDRAKISFESSFMYTDDYDIDFGDGNSNLLQPPTYTSFLHTYKDTGHMLVKITARNNNGCETEHTDSVFVEDIFSMYVPTAFSPTNKDGLNDRFKPVTTFSNRYQIYIYDRWGTQLYTEECNNKWFTCKGWDGTFNNQPVPEGVYVYVIYVDEETGRHHYESGTITLIH